MRASRIRSVRRQLAVLLLTYDTAEFRGPGIHHRFDDSPTDDFDMDMDQRTRLLGGRGGRIILLGDGREIVTSAGEDDDDDIDMEDRGEAEEIDDADEAKKSTNVNGANDTTRSQREQTPGPDSKAKDKDSSKPEEPKLMAATDSTDTKAVLEGAEQK